MGWMLRKSLLFGAVLLAELVALAGWLTQPLLIAPPLTSSCEAADQTRLRQSVEFLAQQTGQRHFRNRNVLEQTASYIEQQLQQAGGIMRSDPVIVDGEHFRNIVARFGPSVGKPAIVVGAHYDASVNTPGADDNASGVAGLLELARLLGRKPPTKPVELVAYTLEEPPNFGSENMGSWHHAMRLIAEDTRPQVVIVLEMIGYFDDRPGSQAYPVPGLAYLYPDRGNFIGVIGDFGSPRLVRTIKAALSSCAEVPVYSINAPAWMPGIALSDHSSYWAHGLSAVMITDTAYLRNPHYHEVSDLPDTLDYGAMGQVVTGVAAAVRTFDAGR